MAGGCRLAHATCLTAWIHNVNRPRSELCNNAEEDQKTVRGTVFPTTVLMDEAGSATGPRISPQVERAGGGGHPDPCQRHGGARGDAGDAGPQEGLQRDAALPDEQQRRSCLSRHRSLPKPCSHLSSSPSLSWIRTMMFLQPSGPKEDACNDPALHSPKGSGGSDPKQAAGSGWPPASGNQQYHECNIPGGGRPIAGIVAALVGNPGQAGLEIPPACAYLAAVRGQPRPPQAAESDDGHHQPPAVPATSPL